MTHAELLVIQWKAWSIACVLGIRYNESIAIWLCKAHLTGEEVFIVIQQLITPQRPVSWTAITKKKQKQIQLSLFVSKMPCQCVSCICDLQHSMGLEEACRDTVLPFGWLMCTRNTNLTRVFLRPMSVSPLRSSMSEFRSFSIPAQSILREKGRNVGYKDLRRKDDTKSQFYFTCRKLHTSAKQAFCDTLLTLQSQCQGRVGIKHLVFELGQMFTFSALQQCIGWSITCSPCRLFYRQTSARTKAKWEAV